jgi:uncharacterized protein (UPF0333 family)
MIRNSSAEEVTMAIWNRLKQETRGTIAVEFALILPVLILIAIGAVDYGRAMTARSQLDAAARAGLQVLVRNMNDTTGAQTAAQSMADGATVTTTLVCRCPNGAAVACTGGTCAIGVPNRIATIDVARSFTMLVPWPSLEDPISLEATAVGRLR